MSYKDNVKNREYQKEYYEKNKERKKGHRVKRYESYKQHAIESITSGEISVQRNWDMWCDRIKKGAKKHPYSKCFTNEAMFKMMLMGCFYCGDIATTIDRIDSKLGHTPNNCVGCCNGCNISKGAADPSTFVRKAYYRTRGEYYDDDINIWFENKNKPTSSSYKMRAKNQGVSFDLSKEDFDVLVVGDCKYCHRRPDTWFGIDRVDPSLGYVLDNVVSCCYDCNIDKLDGDVDTMIMRNERIVGRVDAGELVIKDCDKLILHKGVHKSSKKVCAHGKIYPSMIGASRSLVECREFVSNCIRNENQTDDIFEISDEFYEEHKYSDMYITKNMFIAFEHFYTNI